MERGTFQNRRSAAAALVAVVLLVGSIFFLSQPAEQLTSAEEKLPDETRVALIAAQRAADAAAAQSRRLEAQAENARTEEERARLNLAGLAARLQAAEAQAGLTEARLHLIAKERQQASQQLAAERGPLVQLTAGLQRLALRPAALAALQPGSAQEAVYLRAVLSQAAPAITEKTAGLRQQLRRSQVLAERQRQDLAALQRSKAELATRRAQLQATATRYRERHARASLAAQQEAQRAAELALQTRDLGELVERFDQMAALRSELAALPGPMLRPDLAKSGASLPQAAALPIRAPHVQSSFALRLPVIGQLTGGFGDIDDNGMKRTGLTLNPRANALAVAPASGRVAFAGSYQGFGQVVILEHPGGWTSLVTGLSSLKIEVGEEVESGTPLGNAARERPEITFELRQNGKPVDPLPYVLAGSG